MPPHFHGDTLTAPQSPSPPVGPLLHNPSWGGSSGVTCLEVPSRMNLDGGGWQGRCLVPMGIPLQCTPWPQSATDGMGLPKVSQQALWSCLSACPRATVKYHQSLTDI